MENKNIKDYLHLYIGCDVSCRSEFPEFERTARLDGVVIDLPNDLHPVKVSCYPEGFKNRFHYQYKFSAVKPILRPLSDMTEEEITQWKSISDANQFPTVKHMAAEVQWMLSKGFDLFDLIPSGLAIDKTKLTDHGN